MAADPTHRPFVTVASGVPRSGTSLLMQLLVAGGIPALADGARPADADNPRGYFELEAVKGLRAGGGFPAGAAGQAVKVVHVLLPALPEGLSYRVLFVRRDLREVVASQRAMLRRQGKPAAAVADDQLISVFERQVAQALAWCRDQPHVRCLEVEHRALVRADPALLSDINRFLGGGLDVEAMAAVPDASLYRQRAAT